MRTILFALLIIMAAVCSAKTATPTSHNGPIAIITPDIAIGVKMYDIKFSRSTAAGMEMCTKVESDNYPVVDCNQWTPIARVVPIGTTYVGFSYLVVGYGTYIQIWYK